MSLFRIKTGRTLYTIYNDEFGSNYIIYHCVNHNVYTNPGYYYEGVRFSSVQSAKRSILRSLNKVKGK